MGQPEIREALVDAAKSANAEAHRVISAAYVKFVENKTIEELPGWYFHDLRLLVMALLANPTCGNNEAEDLAELYDRINARSHVGSDATP